MRIISLAVFCCSVLVLNLGGSEIPLAEKGHPRLFFTNADIPSLKTASIEPSGYLLTMKKMTLPYLSGKTVTYQLPPKEFHVPAPPPGFKGEYPYWTGMSSRIKMYIQELTLAYYKTGDKRYSGMIIKYLEALSEWTTWNEHGGMSLSICHFTIGYATGLDAVYELLDDGQKEKLVSALVKLGLQPIYTLGLEKKDHNITAMRYVALGLGGLLLLENNYAPDAASYIRLSKEYAAWYLDKRHNSRDNEGIGYTSFVMDNLMMFADAMKRVTGDSSLLESEYASKEYPLWLIYSLAPGGKSCIMLADYDGRPAGKTAMKIIEKNFQNESARWYLEEAGLESGKEFSDIIYSKRKKEPVSLFPGLPTSAWLKKQGLASMRSSWGNNAVFCALSSSESTCDHTHFDQNSFVLNLNGEWIFTDPGYRNIKGGWRAPDYPGWQYTVMSYGHNTLLVSGKGQDKRGNGKVIDFFHSPWADYSAADATQAYPKEILKKYIRHILCIYPKFFVILDELESPNPEKYELLFHPVSYADMRGDGKKLDIRMRKSDTALRAVSPDDAEINIALYPGAERYGNYAVLSTKGKKQSANFLSVISAESRPLEKGSLEISASPENVSDASHKDFSSIYTLGTNALLFKAKGPDEFISFNVDVPEDGTYDVSSIFFSSPLYGKLSVSIDGKTIGEIHDGYSGTVALGEILHGRIELTNGKHVIKYVCRGKNPEASGFVIGIASVLFKKVQENGVQEKPSPIMSSIIGEKVTGLNIQDSGLTYKFIFNTSGVKEIIREAELNFSGKFAGIGLNEDNAIERYILVNGNMLKYKNQQLVNSDFPCKASFNGDVKSAELVLETSNSGNVHLYMPDCKNITINGKEVDLENCYKDSIFEKSFVKGYYVIRATKKERSWLSFIIPL